MVDSLEQDCLNTTKGFQLLMQATASVMDDKEHGIQMGIIPADCNTDEAIGLLVAKYVFIKFEKEFSPITAHRILETYCRQEIAEAYKVTCYHLYSNFNDFDFSKKMITPIMEIYPMACHVKNVGHKIHWNPFKEPFSSLWICGFEDREPDQILIEESFKLIMAHICDIS